MLVNTNPWTNEEREMLRQLRERGVSVKECAKRLGRSYHSVDCALRRAGVRMPSRRTTTLPALE